eukprot:1182625-Prorocentrum_minimum.AAC.3
MHCFALNELKAMFVAQSCNNPGFTPLILNLLKSDIIGMDKMWSPKETDENGKVRMQHPYKPPIDPLRTPAQR